VVESIPHLVWVAAPDGHLVYLNRRCQEYLGRSIGDLLGWEWTSAVHPDDLARAAESWGRALRTGDEFHAEYRLRRHDGEYRWHVGRALPVHGGGAILRWVGTCTDVDEQKRAEETLRASEARHRAIIENSRDAVVLLSAGGTILYATPAVARTGGRTPEEVVGRNSLEWTHPDDLSGLREQPEAGDGEQKPPRRTESRYRHKDGSWRWVESTTTDMLADPAVGAVVVNFHDVTERKLAEEEQKKFVALVENSADFVGMATLDGRVFYVNPAGRGLVGLDPDAPLRDTRIEDYVPADVAALHREVAIPQALAGDRWEGETRFKHFGTGRLLDMHQCVFIVRSPAGEPLCIATVARDVTERKRLEEQLRQAQKMEAVGRLAGGVAHDFNNLLTVINGYSDIVLASLPAHDPNREFVEEVKKAGERAAGLTRQLLAFGRQQILQRKVLDLNAVVADVVRMLSRVIGEDVDLAVHPGASLWRVQADPGQVEQVLMNLAVNARDAMPTGGRLAIQTRNVTLDRSTAPDGSEVRPGPYVRLSVSDAGCGMDAATLAHVFEPFFTTKGVGKGTGLGLATVYGIVKQSEGHIEVETAVGRGTTFRIFLPAVLAEPGAGEPALGSSTQPVGKETVLVVEDEDGVRALTRLTLQRLGYRVLEAGGLEEAVCVARASRCPVDLLVTDVVMPGAGGRAVAERLRQEYPGLRVLFMSGYTDDAVVRHGVASDRADFIQKPFAPGGLARKVRHVLDRPA
jgi:PAS domain S-box-containing protein